MSKTQWLNAGLVIAAVWLTGAGCALQDGLRKMGSVFHGARDGAAAEAAIPGSATSEYVVVDLSSGWAADAYGVQMYKTLPQAADPAEFKTSKLLLRRVPGGTYQVGAPEHEVGRRFDETPHGVVLSRDYYVSVYEVTQKQWNLVMGSSPSVYQGETAPVENVSWMLVRGGKWPGGDPTQGSFVGRLRTRTRGMQFDLPTEAQWEVACRAGSSTALNSQRNLRFADRDPELDAVAWHFHNVESGTHHEVGMKAPNAWGLYDLHGNVWEMCLDASTDYPRGTVKDPVGAEVKNPQSARRVVRGGGFRNHMAATFRSAYRGFELPTTRKADVGFRLVLNTVPEP